jgi:hypothetical protein
MSMFNRISMRALLTSSIVALALGGCSFSYSSGSAPPSHSSSNRGKQLPKKSSPKKVDNREKPLPSKSGEKPLTKAQPDPDPTPAPEREVEATDDAPERTKAAPKRTKGAPKRTPTGDTTETVEAEDDVSPSSVGSLKAKPKPKTPPSSQGTLVAPQ